MNKAHIRNNIIGISSSQSFSSNDFSFKSKIIEESHKLKKQYIFFRALPLKLLIFDIVTVSFSPSAYPIN